MRDDPTEFPKTLYASEGVSVTREQNGWTTLDCDGYELPLPPGVVTHVGSELLGVGGTQTVSEARDELLANFNRAKRDKLYCPCCGKNATPYERPFTRMDAKVLITLCRASCDKLGLTFGSVGPDLDKLWPTDGGPWWVTDEAGSKALEKYGINPNSHSRTWPALRYRGLLQKLPRDRSMKTTYKGSAHWRPTKLGVLFAEGRVQVPHKVATFNNALPVGVWLRYLGRPENLVAIDETRNFDYQAFLRGEDGV